MRKYEFRLWDIRNEKMSDNFELGSILCEMIRPGDIIMQNTGLKDKTKFEELTKQEQDAWLINNKKEDWGGKEIYEGDIVKIDNWKNRIYCPKCKHYQSEYGYGVISFQNEISGEERNYSTARYTYKIDYHEYELEDTKTMKVIGNIYQNPELLEKEK